MKRILCIVLTVVLLLGALPLTTAAASKSVVEKRIEAVAKVYPQNSTFDQWVQVGIHGNIIQEYGGCSGLVSYGTWKVFGRAYCCEDCGGFYAVGSASTSNTAAMKKLFAKAKIGDIVEWTKGSRVTHHALFLSDNKDGIRIYEANFGGPNQVWYNHQWPWWAMKTWPTGGADKVKIIRADNYSAVNKGKSAKEPVGKVYTVSEYEKIKVKVLDSGIGKGNVQLLSGYVKGANLPKYVAVNDDYVVTAFNDKNLYKECDANSFRIYTVVKAPGASKQVTAKPAKTSVKLSWKKVSGADGYRVYQYNTKTKKYVTIKSATTATTLTVKGLKKNTSYTFAVKAYKKVSGTRIWAEKGKSLTVKTKKK